MSADAEDDSLPHVHSHCFSVVPQIMKQLQRSLVDCQANFEVDSQRNLVTIHRVKRFWLSDGQYGLTFYTHSVSVDASVFIAAPNVIAFE